MFATGMMKACMSTEQVKQVEISKDEKFSDAHSIPTDAPLFLLDRFKCLFVCFFLVLIGLTVPISPKPRVICAQSLLWMAPLKNVL